jgi:hypothetical protein
MYKEFDIVKATVDINEAVTKGCVGVVLAIYGEPARHFLIEFVDKNNDRLDLITVNSEQIESKEKN